MKRNRSLTRIGLAFGASAFLALPAVVPASASTAIVNDVSVSASSGGGTSHAGASIRTEVNGRVAEDTHVATSSGSIHVEQHIAAEDGKPIEKRSSVTYPLLPPLRLPDPSATSSAVTRSSQKSSGEGKNRILPSTTAPAGQRDAVERQAVRQAYGSDVSAAVRAGRTASRTGTSSVRMVRRAEEALAAIKKFFIHVVLFVRA
jgi:hypothetical protein